MTLSLLCNHSATDNTGFNSVMSQLEVPLISSVGRSEYTTPNPQLEKLLLRCSEDNSRRLLELRRDLGLVLQCPFGWCSGMHRRPLAKMGDHGK
eukprot:SAG31_NODE_607_length_13606_cov_11.366699_12_plen_94_part_00